MSLQSYLEQQRARIDQELQRLAPPETEIPAVVHRAMRYSLFAGGKRIRSIFCLEAAGLVSPEPGPDIETISCSLELVHTYSLIHDDLPALDNDDFRRGKLTCHKEFGKDNKAFGEAIAILAGDALLTLAFQVLANLPRTPPAVKAALVAELARAAGTVNGMIGGQVADLEAVNGPLSPETLEYIHRSKTGALFCASVRLGAIGAQADAEQLAAITCFGENAGLAFQIVDDILDVESSTESLGKTAGKDAVQKKVTYPALYGLERSKQMAAGYIGQAKAALDPFGPRATRLKELADYLVSRKA
ncbi:MAG: polyprenyl synthetase [Acidobacteria bacterium RIFCSPLOWO2_02_FULL_61_28]|nr:MAG: polyprenyl synthetase [Acidobacteria bacterium RIFCSPLOWO2_02_FULL_61_28]